MMIKQLQWSAILCSCLFWTNAQAVEMTLSSNATEIPQGQIKDAIVSNLPSAVSQLGSDYQLFAIVETGDYLPGQRLYSYSVTLQGDRQHYNLWTPRDAFTVEGCKVFSCVHGKFTKAWTKIHNLSVVI